MEIINYSEINEKKIDAIYIFNENGVRLLSCTSRTDLLDADLVIGFFTAIKNFGSEYIPGGKIKSLTMSGNRIFYNDYKNITFCIMSRDDLPVPVINYILDEISNKFLEFYGDILNNWNGNLNIFSDFKSYLLTFLERSLIEKILEEFGYNIYAEGVILYDNKNGKILYAKVPSQFSSKQKIALGGMLINFAKNFSNEFQGGNIQSILISAEKKWICVSKEIDFYIVVLFPKTKSIDINIIIKKTEETLINVLKILKF
ncbi:MAG: hypothetical protein ACTSQG_00725 [Promethearchaeota archaeon]